jgi:hypothetical protein
MSHPPPAIGADLLDAAVLRALRQIGPRASLRRVASEVRRHHVVVKASWLRLADRGLCPPPADRPGPPPGTVGKHPEPPTAEEIAERCRAEQAAWAEDDPRLAPRWRVPTGRLFLETGR